jgi:hypothetical protein
VLQEEDMLCLTDYSYLVSQLCDCLEGEGRNGVILERRMTIEKDRMMNYSKSELYAKRQVYVYFFGKYMPRYREYEKGIGWCK